MAERHTLLLIRENRDKAHQGVDAAIAKSATGKPWMLELRERTRSDDQNDALHGLISQIMKQRRVHNGVQMDKAEWKATFMAALGHEVKLLPRLDGDGFFPLGLSTSQLTVSEFSDLIELILAWCAREGIKVEYFDGSQGASGAKNPAREAA